GEWSCSYPRNVCCNFHTWLAGDLGSCGCRRGKQSKPNLSHMDSIDRVGGRHQQLLGRTLPRFGLQQLRPDWHPYSDLIQRRGPYAVDELQLSGAGSGYGWEYGTVFIDSEPWHARYDSIFAGEFSCDVTIQHRDRSVVDGIDRYRRVNRQLLVGALSGCELHKLRPSWHPDGDYLQRYWVDEWKHL